MNSFDVSCIKLSQRTHTRKLLLMDDYHIPTMSESIVQVMITRPEDEIDSQQQNVPHRPKSY